MKHENSNFFFSRKTFSSDVTLEGKVNVVVALATITIKGDDC